MNHDTPIRDLPGYLSLSSPAWNILSASRLQTYGDLLEAKNLRTAIRAISQCGPARAKEILDWVSGLKEAT